MTTKRSMHTIQENQANKEIRHTKGNKETSKGVLKDLAAGALQTA